MGSPTAEEQLKFLTNLQRLLAEGQFVATYKYALLLALADIAVESGDDSGNPLIAICIWPRPFSWGRDRLGRFFRPLQVVHK